MIKVQQKHAIPTSVIRVASERELSEYEKNKLATIEEQAQKNKLEVIRINGERVPIDTDTKTANIKMGDLAFKSVVTSDDIDSKELFFIKCSLD